MKVVYLDSGSHEAQQIRGWLEEAGHQVFYTGAEDAVIDALCRGGVDVALVNWDMDDLDCMHVVHEATRNTHDLPILVASQEASREEIAEALSHDLCEFLSRPISQSELLGRLDSIWQHMGIRDATPQYADKLGPWRVLPDRREILLNGEPIVLTDKDFEVAQFLFRNVGKVLTRRELLREVWGIDAPVETRTVDVHVSRVRRGLEIDGRHGYHIKTIYQQGYCLEALQD